MSNTKTLYDQTLESATTFIVELGTELTPIIIGYMGQGKTALLKNVATRFPEHTALYLDCTSIGIGDLAIPYFQTMGENGCVTMLPNEMLGIHLNKPCIIMVDEFGKADPSVKKALLRLMHERTFGSYTLHPDSRIFATTNKASEGVGDVLQAHACNRVVQIHLRKYSALEQIEYGVNNNWHPAVLGFMKEFPQIMDSFEDIKDPADNPYIHHPRDPSRTAFVTNRSLENASKICWKRDQLGDDLLTAALMGTIGARGGLDLMSFIKMVDQLPTTESIRNTPETAIVPTSASAMCMVIYKIMGAMDDKLITPWMVYMDRIDKEAQGLFANGVRVTNYKHRSIVMRNAKFTAWSLANGYMFASDIK